MADLKINTDIALEFGREFDIYELANSDEMSELRAGFEPVPYGLNSSVTTCFLYKKVGFKMKLLKITSTIIMSALLVVANADNKQMARVLYKSVDSNNQTLMTGIKVEVRNKDSGKVVESFVAHSKMLLLPLSSRFEIVGLNEKTGEKETQSFATSFEPSGSSEVILRFEK